MHVVSHAGIACDKKRFNASDGLRVFANISPLISTTGINHGLDHVKCVEVLVRRSSPVRKLASTRNFFIVQLYSMRNVYRKNKRTTMVLANLRTGLDLRTNTSTHFTWSSPRFIPVVLIGGHIRKF